MQTVVLISPTNSTPSQSQKHDLWEGKTCQWLTDSLSLSLSLSLTSGRTPQATAREYCPILKMSKLST